MSLTASRTVRRLTALLPLALAGCSALPGGSKEGPFLPTGPLPGRGEAEVAPVADRTNPALASLSLAVPETWGAMPAAAAAAPAPLSVPADFAADNGMTRLPGARVAGVAPVRALVVPLSLDGKMPVKSEQVLQREIFGNGDLAEGPTLAKALAVASFGRFRLSSHVLTPLVDRRPASRFNRPSDIRSLAEASLQTWARSKNLAEFDNDGPDGLPSSGDDDGTLDFVIFAVEADGGFPSFTIRDGLTLESGGRKIQTGPIHVLGTDRAGGDPLPAAIGLTLDALGLETAERFFPGTFPRMISSLARVRLGWMPARPAVESERAQIGAGEALVVQLTDLAQGDGFWLIENDGSNTYATRVVRTAAGRFVPSESRHWRAGSPLVLALSRQLGPIGPRVVIEGKAAPHLVWAGEGAPNPWGSPEKSVTARW